MRPTLTELQKYTQYPDVPVVETIDLPKFDPQQLITILHQQGKDCASLTISENNQRYSYFAINPKTSFTYNDGQLAIKNRQRKVDIHQYLQKLLQRFATPKINGLPPFTGGLLGYFSYDYFKYNVGKLNLTVANPDNLQDLGLFLLDSVIFYDHQQKQLGISKIIPTADLASQYRNAAEKLSAQLAELISGLNQPVSAPDFQLTSDLQPAHSLGQYTKQVEQIREHIYQGDIFQMIYSNPQLATTRGSLLKVAGALRQQNPSPYEFYFKQGNFEAAGASPETLVKKAGQHLATYPLAGTRRRGQTAAEDAKFEHELQTDPKEIAEHNMLVDLGRNDLGRVAQFGSVKVTQHLAILKFSQVMHLGSTVIAKSQPQTTALQVLNSTFPAGTLSGAPKVRAVELIDQFETRKRGLYGGSFGYLDFNGNLDMGIGIRLAHQTKGHLTIHAGAGIVFDSIGKNEYQECFNKARAVVKAVKTAAEEDQHAIID